MKILDQVNTEKVVSIDIETVRLYKNYKDAPEDIRAAWRYDRKWKDESKLAENNEKDLARLWENEASFKPEYSKIVAISLAFQNKGVLRCKEFASEDELLLLTNLAETLNKLAADFTLVAHAGYFFDFPYLAMRFLYNKIPLPGILDESGLSPWLKKLLDTNHIRKSFGTSSGGSLLSLCLAFGIPFTKSEISGEDVGGKYFEGKLGEISAYCSLDTIAGYNLLRAFKGESIFQPEDVVYVNQGEILVPAPPPPPTPQLPLFDEIIKDGKISPKNRVKIRQEAKRLETLGEKENLVLLIKSALSRKEGEFDAGDEALFVEILTI